MPFRPLQRKCLLHSSWPRPDLPVQRLSNFLQVLIFLPLTLSTLSKPAFLLLSLLIFLQSLLHGTLRFLWDSSLLPAMQLPIQPFLLLVCFNLFSQSVNPLLLSLASWWGTILTLSSPLFIILESVSSLLVAQKLGHVGQELVGKGEVYQFILLIVSAVAYVVSAWWIVAVSAQSSIRVCFLRINLLYETGLSRSRHVAAVSHSTWRCFDGVSFSYSYRIWVTSNECH